MNYFSELLNEMRYAGDDWSENIIKAGKELIEAANNDRLCLVDDKGAYFIKRGSNNEIYYFNAQPRENRYKEFIYEHDRFKGDEAVKFIKENKPHSDRDFAQNFKLSLIKRFGEDTFDRFY